jgi:RNA polymerase sigma factor (sigma-70 family)
VVESVGVTAPDSAAAIETVFRIEFGRLVAGLARRVGDIGLAEDLAQDALVAALRQWPESGIPRNPGAWLMTVAKRKAVDGFRRSRTLESKYARIGAEPVVHDPLVAGVAGVAGPGGDAGSDDPIEDDRLRLIFVSCHPVLPVASRAALSLRLLGGLTTGEIGRAYLLPEATIAQRIVRAKKTIARAGVPFEIPTGADRAVRLRSVLEVVYLIYNEGYSATSGPDWLRPELCAEALRLGRLLAALAPEEPEAHGLLALMEIQSSRLHARTGPGGEPVLLLDQDRRKWDRLLINRGLASLSRAEQLDRDRGPYTLQAAIAACHARAFRPEETDWNRLAGLYGQLAVKSPSPIVELNRAVAVSMASGPEWGLQLVDQLVETATLDRYHLLHSVRGDLLERLGRHDAAGAEFERAASLAQNERERQLSVERARTSRRLAHGDPDPDRSDQPGQRDQPDHWDQPGRR